MPATLLHADRALTPLEEIHDAALLIEDGRIVYAGPRSGLSAPRQAREIRAAGLTAVPGFLDVHIHGAGGHDVMEASRESLDAITATLARHGTTSLLATTVSASPGQICRSAVGIGQYIRSRRGSLPLAPCAEILGIHFEGPFISPARRGVHPEECIQEATVPRLHEFLAAAGATAKILTLAPEVEGAPAAITVARGAGLVVAMGHTDATYHVARAAIDRGVRHAVHVFNAMRPFSHRETGVIGAVLTSPDVTAELIADGVHVDEAAMKLLLLAKGIERVILVSDATAATAMPDGRYTLGTFEVTVAGGVCRNAEGKLAGSTLTLDCALRNVVALGVSLRDALRMLTLNPAKLLGMENQKGVLRAGADADVVLLDENLQVARVITRGAYL